ncbi:MAG TPA: acetylglutamate kinase [Candidatus Cybelea sp.]|nr:acetylglutamate kinase [Candidatus Cybelea sp.]
MTHEYARGPSQKGTLVVKYGGNAMARSVGADPLLAEVAALRQAGEPVVLVHGGGPEIDAALAARGVATTRIDGLRVTDAVTLEITEAVLCATINKRIVRALLALGTPAAGFSGVDGGTLIARRARSASGADLGYVGEISAVEPQLIHALLRAGFLPVVAPVAIAENAEHAYNVNADLAAGAIASALRAAAFVLVTNVSRVLRDPDDPSSGIDRFTPKEALNFTTTDACRSSMKPKLQAAAIAVRDGTAAAYICAAGIDAIARARAGDATIVCATRGC